MAASAQNCDSNYFSFSYMASDFVTFSKALHTPDNSVLCLQTNRLYQHGITKFTPQGNPIFSYQYTAPFAANGNHAWTDLVFTDMAISSDGAVYMAGSVTKHGLFFDNKEVPPPRTAAAIVKADKYGKVIWSRFFANASTDLLSFSDVLILSNGDIVCYLATEAQLPFYGRVVCLTKDGTFKWLITLNTGEFSSGDKDFPKRAMTESKNGNIVIGDVVYNFHADFTSTREYHFFALHPTDGSIVWETSYDYGQSSFLSDVINTYELPDGDFCFQTTMSDSVAGDPYPLEKALTIITDDTGNIKKILATHPANDAVSFIDAKPDGNSGDQALLLSNNEKPILVQMDKEGNIKRSRKYGKSDDNVPPTCFINIAGGYDIFLSDFAKSFLMLRTDPVGRLDCDSLPVNLVQEVYLRFNGTINNIHTKNLPVVSEDPYSSGFFTVENTITTSIQRNTICQKNIPCCVDVVDTMNINNIFLCEGSTYTLPDKTVVSDSGKYYISFKTTTSCDSVRLYKISLYKNPAALSLGLDTCFNGSDSITLQATNGYNSYLWMGNTPSLSSVYIAHRPGAYDVSVSNVCGSKTDSVHVYEQCDLPIYMPDAFTPNGDQLNDVFKVPSININHFISLTIFNRWGKIVFQTDKVQKGWDGTINGIPQNQGLYIYRLQMENLLGKEMIQKGIVTLLK